MKTTRTPLWRRVLASVTLFALIFTLAPPIEVARAAVSIVTQPVELVLENEYQVGASSGDKVVAQFGLNATDSETLSTVAVKLYDYNNTSLAATDFVNMKLWRDNGDGSFVASGGTADTVLATCITLGAFSSRYSTTTISGNSCDGSTPITPSAPLPTSMSDDRYFITVATDTTWDDNGANMMWNPTAADAFTVDIDADAIVTSAGAATTTALVGSMWRSADTTAPLVMNAFVPTSVSATGVGTTVEVFFSEFLEKTSIECSDQTACDLIYTLSGGLHATAAVAMSGCTACTDADAVQLTLGAAATNDTTTITLVDGLIDDGGNAVISASAVTLAMNMPPMITGFRKVDASNLILEFNQEMTDGTDCGGVENTSAYTLTIDGSTVADAVIELQAGNQEVKFTKTNAFINAGVGGDDSIQVQNLPDQCATPQNTSSMKLQGDNWFSIDAAAPQVTGLVKDDATHKIWIKFNEWVDGVTAQTATNYVDADTTKPTTAELMQYDPDTNPTWFTNDMSGKVVELTFADIGDVATSITVSGVTDMAGNVVDASYNTAVLSASNAIAIASAITTTFTNGKWNGMLDGCNSDDPGNTGLTCTDAASSNNRDAIYIVFTGPIDTAYLGENANGIITNIGSFLEIYDSWTYAGASANDCQSGHTWGATTYEDGAGCEGKNSANLDESYGVVIDNEATNFTVNSNSIANDVLIIYTKGWVNLWPPMQINPSGIKGLNGLSATQHATASYNQLPQPTFAEVEFVVTSGLTAGSTVTFFFDTDMNRTDLDTA